MAYNESTRILNLLIVGEDAYTPTMNRLNGSLTNSARVAGRAYDQMGRGAGFVSEQFRILRRTAEYAVSGFAIYKVIQAVQTYKQFRTELGLLNANLMTSGRNLENLGQSAIKVAQATVTPINDVMQSFQNIAATFPGLQRNLIPIFSQIEARASRVMQTEPQQVGSAINALITTFQGRRALRGTPSQVEQRVGRVADELVTTLFTNPRVTGQDITQYIPPLGGFAKAAGFTLPQTLALFSVVQRQIARPATSAQYLRQLLIRLRQPTKGEEPFFAKAGLPPDVLAGKTGIGALNALIQYGLGLGATVGGRQVSGAGAMQAAQSAGWKQVALSPQAAQFFRQAIGGRMQSLVAITGLVRNLGQVTIQEQKLMSSSTNQLDKRWNAWLNQNRMTQAANNFSLMTLSMINDLNPFIQKTAQASASVFKWFTDINTYGQRGAGLLNKYVLGPVVGGQQNAARFHLGGLSEVAGIGALILGIRKSGLGGAVLGQLRNVPGLGKILARGGAAEAESLVGGVLGAPLKANLSVQALASALSGRGPTGTPTNPFWVVIHPLSDQTFSGGKYSKSTSQNLEQMLKKQGISIGQKAEGPAEGALAGALATKGGRSFLGNALRVGGRNLARIGGAFLLPWMASKAIGGTIQAITGVNMGSENAFPSFMNRPLFRNAPGLGFTSVGHSAPWQQNLMRQAMWRNPQGLPLLYGNQDQHFTFHLNPTQELKDFIKPAKVIVKTRRGHVTAQYISEAAPAPTTRGKTTARMG